MPLYELSVSTAAQQSEASANTATVTVEEPVITEGMIFIDPGASDEVRAELRFGDRRILPHPNSDPFSVPAIRNFSPINVQLPGVPTSLELRAWAPDADFAHEVICQVEAVTEENAAESVRLVGVEDTTASVEPATIDLSEE